MRNSCILATMGMLAAWPAHSQQPLSAIEWLSAVEAASEADSMPVAAPSRNSPIESTELDALRWDAVGLVSSELAGLPKELWKRSDGGEIERRIADLDIDSLPAALELLYILLLTESDPPENSVSDGSLFLARVDKLFELGALEHAEALLERVGPTKPEAFRKWFDISLLTGYENRACAAMMSIPELAPNFAARIFCLVRDGQWSAAAVSLSAARAIGAISASEAEPLKYFLYPELIGDGPLPEPSALTPLDFRMREAIGQPPQRSSLPLAFDYRHLSGILGWKAKIEACERLARSGAIPPGTLFSAYLERPPPASGGVWDRVRSIQALDLALLSKNLDEVGGLLPGISGSMKESGLGVAFSRFFGPRILRLGIIENARAELFEIALLSDEYAAAVQDFPAESRREMFLQSLALGEPSLLLAHTPLEAAIASALSGREFDGEFIDLLDQGKLGEALLRSLEQLSNSRQADPFDVGEALAALSKAGLDRVATKVALQMLVTIDRI